MVTREQVRHVARLAKLRLSPQEEERFASQLGEILEYVELLREIDDEAASELTHVAGAERAPRPDEPRPCLPRDRILALAPRSDGETFHVPAVLDREGTA